MSPDPGEWLFLFIGIQSVIDEKVPRGLVEQIYILLYRVITLSQRRRCLAPMRQLPLLLVLRDVGRSVFDSAAPLQDERLEPILTEFLGCPAPGHSRTDNDGVV